MRGAVLALLCVIALSNAEIVELNQNGCPKDPTYERTLAHKSCFQYYQCVNGIHVARTCPEGLLYNRESKACDLAKNVKCDSADHDEDKVVNDDPSEAPAICSKNNSEGVLVAHEICSKFYKCSRGLPSAFVCPLNLLYNPIKEYCDWPINVNCGDRTIPDDKENEESDSDNEGNNNEDSNCDPSAAPAICAKEGSDGVLVANEICNKFYKCNKGSPVTINCPSNLLYNPVKQQCDWPQNVECGDRTLPGDKVDEETDDDNEINDNNIDVNCDPSEAPAICANKDSNGMLVAHEICTKFYKCFNGHPVPLSCPSGLLYNPPKKYCDWPSNVECGDRIIPEDNEEEDGNDNGSNDNGSINCDPSKAPAICSNDGSDGILVAHEKCHKFYKCFEGLPVAFSCPLNLLYDPRKEQCQWPESVSCGNRLIPDDSIEEENGNNNDSNSTGNCDPSEAPAICAEGGSDGVLVAHEICTKFYKCFGGLPVALDCPSGLLYNPQTEYCDWPNNVICGERIIPDDKNNDAIDIKNIDVHCNPSEAPMICEKVDSNGILIAHEKCNNFYKCYEGHPVALSCPPNLLYDPIKKQCNWADQVECGNREISENEDLDHDEKENNYDPSKAPAICEAKESDGVLVAHEKCNHFYQCSGGIPVELKCPTNLLFNSKLWICDWPESVVCGDRYIPEEEDQEDVDEDEKEVEDEDQEEKEIHCDPSKAPTICAAKGSDGTLVAHEKCNKFYMCAKGITMSFECPQGLLYNPFNKQCDWPLNVTCDSREIPEYWK